MTAKEFIAKWQASTLKERSASQSHFNDLYALIGHPNGRSRLGGIEVSGSEDKGRDCGDDFGDEKGG